MDDPTQETDSLANFADTMGLVTEEVAKAKTAEIITPPPATPPEVAPPLGPPATQEETDKGASEFVQAMGVGGKQELPPARDALAGRWGAPPFSVLDSKQPYWQERKRLWVSLGIQSEVGRAKVQASLAGAYKTQASKSANKVVDDADVPAWVTTSIFDPVLCELMYRWFSPPGGLCLDPFAGGSVRGIVASIVGRKYTGVDLSAVQVEANRAQAVAMNVAPVWHVGDSTHIDTLAPGSYDFVFSCPPYLDLEVYSDDPNDLSNKDDEAFTQAYELIIAKACSMLKLDRFACFVVGDVRAKDGAYRNFCYRTALAFEKAGLVLYNKAGFLVQTPVGTAAVRANRQFSLSRKVVGCHQDVLVFLKGDWHRAVEAVGPIYLSNFEYGLKPGELVKLEGGLEV